MTKLNNEPFCVVINYVSCQNSCFFWVVNFDFDILLCFYCQFQIHALLRAFVANENINLPVNYSYANDWRKYDMSYMI